MTFQNVASSIGLVGSGENADRVMQEQALFTMNPNLNVLAIKAAHIAYHTLVAGAAIFAAGLLVKGLAPLFAMKLVVLILTSQHLAKEIHPKFGNYKISGVIGVLAHVYLAATTAGVVPGMLYIAAKIS